MRWWNHSSFSMMASDAMGRLTASVWRKSGVIGSFKRPGWIGPIFWGWLNSYRNGVDFWGLLPTLQEWLNLKIFSSANWSAMNAKPTARPTCDQLCMLKDIQLMNSGIIASNQDLFVPWPGFFLLRSVRALFYHQFFKVISLRGMCSSRQLPTSPLPDVYDKMVCYACDPSWMWLMAGWQCSQKFIAGYNFVWGWMWWWTECLAWV